MDPMLIAMLGSIGLQFFTNNKNNAKAREIQESQKEYQKAAQLRQFERMRNIQSEQARLAMELEMEIHKERMDEIEKEYDEVLDRLIDNIALQNWPLNVLPFIMRGESYGSLIRNGSKTIAIHCILTPSNCPNFNKEIYKELDFRLEAQMNSNWNPMTTHPVVYYGGAWKKNSSNEDDLITDIQLLRTQISSIPCMVITPYFENCGLTFHVNMWGMGEDRPTFTIVPPSNLFSYESYYKKGLDYGYTEEYGDDLYNTTIEEFVPYIESLIGFVADKYFWSMYGIAPVFPSLLSSLIENKQIIHEECQQLYKNMLLYNDCTYRSKNCLELYDNIKSLYTYKERISLLDDFASKRLDEKKMDYSHLPIIELLISKYEDEVKKKHYIGLKEKILKDYTSFENVYCATVDELHYVIKSYIQKRNCSRAVFKVLDNSLIIVVPKNNDILQNGQYLICSTRTPMFHNNGVYELRENFKAYSSSTDPFVNVDLNLDSIIRKKHEQNRVFDMCVELFERLNTDTDIESFLNIENAYLSIQDVECWINENNKAEYTGVNIYKGFSKKHNKYLLFGVFVIDNEIQLSKTTLISYYDHIPDDINSLFSNSNNYRLTFN